MQPLSFCVCVCVFICACVFVCACAGALCCICAVPPFVHLHSRQGLSIGSGRGEQGDHHLTCIFLYNICLSEGERGGEGGRKEKKGGKGALTQPKYSLIPTLMGWLAFKFLFWSICMALTAFARWCVLWVITCRCIGGGQN